MTLKQFLKPDWIKIVVFVCIFLLGSILYDICTSFVFGSVIGGTTPEFCSIILPLFAFYVVGIIPSYLLSCFIVWIYDKVKKKK